MYFLYLVLAFIPCWNTFVHKKYSTILSSSTATFTGHKLFCPKRAVGSWRNKNSDCSTEEPKHSFAEVWGFYKDPDPHVSKHWNNTLMMRGRNIELRITEFQLPLRKLSLDMSSYYLIIISSYITHSHLTKCFLTSEAVCHDL